MNPPTTDGDNAAAPPPDVAAHTVQTTINGTPHRFENVHPDDTAIDLIRQRTGLTGTKLSCGGGVCGACTVLIDGTPMTSCVLPANRLAGRNVQTVEDHNRDALHPVQRAFIACDALQCGFCTPGYINESIAFYMRWREAHGTTTPSREEVANALAGHLCRCGAYVGIYEAVQRACAGEFDDDVTKDAEIESPRCEAFDKVTGAAKYTVDIAYDDLLEGRILRSPHAHARVLSVDASPALEMEGVLGFADLMAGERTVRYVGQPIAAIAAVDQRMAEAALARVRVQYEVLPAVISMDAARQDDAPVIYDGWRKDPPSAAEGFTLPGTWNRNQRRGLLKITTWQPARARRTINRARSANDPQLVERTFRNAPQVHTALEPHACVARWEGPTALHVHASSQNVHQLRGEIAEHFDLEDEQVQVTSQHIGGGFGAKSGLYNEIIAAVSLARAANQPVRVACDRLEEMSYTGFRPGTEVQMAVVSDADAEPQAMTVTAYGNAGSAVGNNTAPLMGFFLNMTRDLEQYDVVTNVAPGSPFRGPDGPPVFWALEQTIDEAAHKAGLDPLTVRRKWDADNDVRQKLYDWVAALPAWQARSTLENQEGRFRRGIGMACGSWMFIYNPDAKVRVAATPEGILVESATQDIGNGVRSVLATTVAEVFRLPRREIRVRIGESDAPIGPVAGGSQVTNSIYGPAHTAAEKVRAHLLEAAQQELGLRNVRQGEGGIEHEDGFLPWRELLPQVQPFEATETRGYERGMLGLPKSVPANDENSPSVGFRMSHAVTVTEVEVDMRLGKIRPLHVWMAVAAGRIFVPTLARSQVYGGVIQGLGYALYEEKVLDQATGHNLTVNLEEYKIPGIGDMPEIHAHFIEDGFEEIRGGGIGIAELTTVGVSASVGNAVFHATGWRPLNTPIQPSDIVQNVAQPDNSVQNVAKGASA